MAKASETVNIAKAQLGTKEAPAGSNRVKYNAWFYGREVSGGAYPWCMAFVQWCFAQAGAAELLPMRTPSCGALCRAAQGAGLWVTKDLRPGDVVIYSFSGKGTTDHCGIVEQVSGGTVTAIEGNTSERGSQSNGGMVCRKDRPLAKVLGALRPEYEAEDGRMDNTPGKYAEQAVAWARETGLLQGNTAGDLMLHSPVTREQLIVFLHRFKKML